MSPKKLKAGSTLGVDWLNGVANDAGAGRLRIDPATGLKLIRTPFGALLRALYPPDGWFLITAGGGGGSYTLHEQIEASGGTWTTGVRVITAYESNLNASVPSGSTKRVWARKRRGQWRFTFGAC